MTVKVPRDPRLWAWLLGWVLQPPWAEERTRLHALIVAWNGGSSNDVDPALARSIVLFHNVMRQAGERVHIEGERVLIRGRFGKSFSIGEQAEFFNKHIEPWAGRLMRDIEAAKTVVFYAPVGTIGKAFLEIESAAFGMDGTG